MDKAAAIPDPTRLVVMDDADRILIKSLEQVRACLDDADFGLVNDIINARRKRKRELRESIKDRKKTTCCV